MVQVTIPAFIFDRIPNAKPVDTADVQNQVILDGLNIKAQIERLKIAMGVSEISSLLVANRERPSCISKNILTRPRFNCEEAFGSPEGISEFLLQNVWAKIRCFYLLN